MIHGHAVLDVAVDSATSLAHNDTIDVKTFLFTFFSYFGHVFTFFIFQTFLFKKNVGILHSGKQINKKHCQSNSNEIDL